MKAATLSTLTVILLFCMRLQTAQAQAPGSTCANPYPITSLPFNQTGLSTCGFGNNYTLGGGTVCGFNNYLLGQDFVFQLTPTISACYNLQIYNVSGGVGAGIFVFQGCPGAGGVCLGSAASANFPFLKIELNAGTTYYIIISSQATFLTDCTGFSFNISDPASAPINDFCENATTLTGFGSNYNATACNEPNSWAPDYNNPAFNQCTGGLWNFNHNGVWYIFNNPQQQNVSIEVFNIQCTGVLSNPTLQVGIWSNTGTCNLDAEAFYGCLVTDGDAVLNLSNLPSGNFYMFVDGSSGSLCNWEFASPQIIPCNEPLIAATSDTVFTLCPSSLIPLTLSIDTTSLQPADLLWLFNGAVLQTNGLSYTTSTPNQGVYTAQISNSCGQAQQNFTVNYLPQPTATLSGGGSLCATPLDSVYINIALNGNPPFTINYQINGIDQPPLIATQNIVTFSTQTPGLYQLTNVEDAACILTAIIGGSAEVIQLPAPTQPLLPDTLNFCLADTPGILTAGALEPGATLNWYATNPNIAPGTALYTGNPFDLSTYINTTQPATLQIWAQQTINGCNSPAALTTLVVYAPPLLSINPTGPICQLAPLPALIATSVGNVSWYNSNPTLGSTAIATGSDLQTSSWVNSNTPGIYTFWAIAQQNGCTSVAIQSSIEVLPPPPAPNTTDVGICEGTPLPPLTTDAVGTVSWYANPADAIPIAQGNTYQPTDTGTYYLNVTDNLSGCTSPFASISLNYISLSSAPAITDMAVCEGTPLPPLTTDAVGMVNWYANPTDVLPIAQGNTYQPTDTGTYYLNVTDALSGCTSPLASVTLSYLALPAAPSITDVAVCEGTPLPPLNTDAVGTVNWYANPADAIPIAQGNTYQPGNAGTYYLNVTDDLSGCTSPMAMVTVSLLPLPPTPTIADVSVCEGTPLPPLTTDAIGTVNWYANPADALPIAQGNTYQPGNAGTYYLNTTDEITGCTSPTISVNVSLLPLPPAPFVADTAICEGTPLPLLQTDAIGLVNWYAGPADALPIAQGNTYQPTNIGSYYLSITDETTGCTSPLTMATVSATIPAITTISYPQNYYCLTDAFTPSAQVSPNISGSFSISGGANINPLNGVIDLSTTQAGQTYTITFQPNLPCASPDTTYVTTQHLTLPTLPDIWLEEGSQLSINATALLNSASTDATYEWFPANSVSCSNCPITTISPPNTTQYQISAANTYGCTQTASFTANVLPRVNKIVMPNAFSPNNDGVNDILIPQGFNVASVEIHIYNRWGKEVFASTNLLNGWNGTYQNQPAPIGVYVYYAQATYTNGQSTIFKGNVTLIR